MNPLQNQIQQLGQSFGNRASFGVRPQNNWRQNLGQLDMSNYVPIAGRAKGIAIAYNPKLIKEGADAFKMEIAKYQQGLAAQARQKASQEAIAKQQQIQRTNYFNTTSPEQRTIARIKAFMASRPRL